jgi:hypothetical protein
MEDNLVIERPEDFVEPLYQRDDVTKSGLLTRIEHALDSILRESQMNL